jgi:hypothetical protein
MTDVLLLCSVCPHENGTISILSHSLPPAPQSSPTHFCDVLRQWKPTWLWDDLKYTGDGTWIYKAIRDQTLICVSDGSFISLLHHHVCSAAITMECTMGSEWLSLSFAEKSLAKNAFCRERLDWWQDTSFYAAWMYLNPGCSAQLRLTLNAYGLCTLSAPYHPQEYRQLGNTPTS